MKDRYFVLLIFLFVAIISCKAEKSNVKKADTLKVGASSIGAYLDLIKNKSVAIVANQTSMVGSTHLVDTLLSLKIDIKKVFAPEHGFRGTADAGALVKDNVDTKTGLPIISLYGNNKKPTNEQLKDLDLIIFDIQDVGTRFYTYISTLQYVMEAAADNGVEVLILDRPNPNGHYVDGPVLDTSLKSFVGMQRIPIVHGLTVGEYALMLVGESWLNTSADINLNIIPVQNYTHSTLFELPIKPSPNLPNMNSVYLYPSLCLFEGTVISVGRGTEKAFQQIGHPELKEYNYKFVPVSTPGAAVNPKHKDQLCYGIDLSKYTDTVSVNQLDLSWLILFYNSGINKQTYFNTFFDKLSGTKILKEQIRSGLSEEQIRISWQTELEKYKTMRRKYLLYPDFD